MASNISWLYNLARKPVAVKQEQTTVVTKTSELVFDAIQECREYAHGKLEEAAVIATTKYQDARTYVAEIDYEGMRENMMQNVLVMQSSVRGTVQRASNFVLSLDPRDIPDEMIMPAVIFVIVVLVLLGLAYRKRQQAIKHRAQYGENAFPPFAPCNWFETVSALTGREQPWFFKQSAKLVGPIFRLRLPFIKAPMFVAIGDVETAKEILQDPDTVKPEAMYRTIEAIAGGPNIVTSEGSHWKLSRKCLTPAFMMAHLDRMHRVCKDQTEEWIENRLEQSIRAGESFDVGEECMFLTIAIMCRAAFEYRIRDAEAKDLMTDLETISRDLGVDDIQSPLFRKLFSSSRRSSEDARTRIQAFGQKILTTYRKGNKMRRQSTAPVKESIISLINKNTHYEDDEHRVADIVMLLISGHETTAYTLAWILLELARNPRELSLLRHALSGSDDDLAQQMLKDILREGMRLRPVSPGIGVRMIGKDFYLKDKAIVIPKGSYIMFPSMVLTRHNVKDPEEFRPSRWTDHPTRTFLPFSTGKRNCVGQALALAEVTWVLSRLCAKYDFQIEDEGKAVFCATLKCVGARLKARHWDRSHGRSF